MVQPLRVRARRSTSDNRRFPSSSGRPLGLSRVAAPTVKETQRYPREEAPDRPDETRKGSRLSIHMISRDTKYGVAIVKRIEKKKLSVEDSGSMMKRFGGGVVSIRSRGCVLEVTEMDGNKAIAPPTKSEQTPSSESNGLEQSNINLSKLPRDDREGLRLVKYLYGTSWSLMEPRGGSWLTSKERGLG
ncbi:hypothetical protein HZH66_006516 [Vespula vulgaris]|uniref:Uncharacterized protein n=1 Tax=Vespula vulgaris TaxID=7454 RepID=A0A834K1F2_VESVU|nr:hypothetical protein HZH66_006516 [Vespula vulgaris]